MQPQSGGGSDASGGAAEIWKARANGHAAALFAARHGDRGKDSWRDHRQAVPGEGVVQQCEEIDRHRQRSAGTGATGLGIVAGPGAAPSLQGQLTPVQLALVQNLWHRRNAEQWNARSGCVPVGAGRGLSKTGRRDRRPISLQRRLAVL